MQVYLTTKRHPHNCYDNSTNSSNGRHIAGTGQWKQAKSKADLKATLLLLTQERFALTAAIVAIAWLD
jgi:hypothetical protein